MTKKNSGACKRRKEAWKPFGCFVRRENEQGGGMLYRRDKSTVTGWRRVNGEEYDSLRKRKKLTVLRVKNGDIFAYSPRGLPRTYAWISGGIVRK